MPAEFVLFVSVAAVCIAVVTAIRLPNLLAFLSSLLAADGAISTDANAAVCRRLGDL